MFPKISRHEFPSPLPSWPSHSILSFVSTHPILRVSVFPESEGDWAWTLSQEGSRDVMAPGAMPSWILFLLWHRYTFLSHPSWKFHCRNIHAPSGEAAGEAGRTSISGFLDTVVIWMLSRENQTSGPSWSTLGHLGSALMAWSQDQQIWKSSSFLEPGSSHT